jgi:hypothetical protein
MTHRKSTDTVERAFQQDRLDSRQIADALADAEYSSKGA